MYKLSVQNVNISGTAKSGLVFGSTTVHLLSIRIILEWFYKFMLMDFLRKAYNHFLFCSASFWKTISICGYEKSNRVIIVSVKLVYSPELFHCWWEGKRLHEHVMFVWRFLLLCCGHEVIPKQGMMNPENQQDLSLFSFSFFSSETVNEKIQRHTWS